MYEAQTSWRERNKERIKQQGKEYRQRNKAKLQQDAVKFKQTHPDYVKQYYHKTKSHRKTLILSLRAKDPVKWLLYHVKSRAKKENLPFNLGAEDLKPYPIHCPVLGVQLNYSGIKGKRDPNRATVDRVIPKKGYVRGNVVIISWRANLLKSDSTLDELRALVKYCESIHK